MPVPYTKPHLSIADQVALLKSRGMSVPDEVSASDYLSKIGYYRLSGYWYPFRAWTPSSASPLPVLSDNFRAGTTFDHALGLYVFDKSLRMLFLDALERIEVGLRVEIALLLSNRDPLAHRNAQELHGAFAKKIDPKTNSTKHAKWLSRLDEVTQQSREEFVVQYKSKYSTPLPMWIAIELWDFGLLAHFVGGLKVTDATTIASKYGMTDWRLLGSWVRTLNFLRNVCAHHSRLWNRVAAQVPARAARGAMPTLDHLFEDRHAETRVYAAAALTQHFMSVINPSSDWNRRLIALMTGFPGGPGLSIKHAGFPDGWEKLALWK